MLGIHELKEIIQLIDKSSVQEFALEHGETKISVKKGLGQAASAVQAAPVQTVVVPDVPVPTPQPVLPEAAVDAPVQHVKSDKIREIVSPMVGTFYAAPEPGASAYVKVGDRVQANTVVCILEAMKLFNEIEAECSGEITEVLVENGQLIQFGQPLFRVKAE